MAAFSYVFGPVRSGRLGLSLGLDLLGSKICSMDCLYCEVGPTRTLTIERAPYVPAAELLAELTRWRNAFPDSAAELDVVTLGGSGEPCLNSDMPEIIAGAKQILPGVPVAVLTNSSLLHDPEVRQELQQADIVLPSLDSLREDEFTRVNRPAPELSARAAAQALLDFRREYAGRIFLEILLVHNVNDSHENIAGMEDYIHELAPERVDIVTLSRPGAYPAAKAATKETLRTWRERLLPGNERATTIAKPRDLGQKETNRTPALKSESPEQLHESIVQSLLRRPQTAEQLAAALSTPEESITEALNTLLQQGRISQLPDDTPPFFKARRARSQDETITTGSAKAP